MAPVAVLLAATALVAGVYAAAAPATDPARQSALTTTGPVPPANVETPTGARRAVSAGGETLVAGVPGYLWRDGCAPTSVGMVIGYYDGRGFPDLVTGDASSQSANPAVDQMIASHGSPGDPRHYEDYALPEDTGGAILADRSAAPAGDEHASDCVADFIHTSWSVDGLAYGWSFTSMTGPGFVAYVESRLTGVTASYRNLYYGSSLDFLALQQEIDAGRPLVLSVDSTGDGVTDHAVVGIGYRETSGYPEYACWDTWFPVIRWQQFRGLSASYAWGVYGATTLTLSATGPSPSPSPSPSVSASPTPSPSPSPSVSPSPSASPSPPPDDVTAPETTVSGGDSSWHRRAVTLTFLATDAGGSGVDSTETDVDGTGWAPLPGLPGTLRVDGQGVHAVRFRSTDLVGNVEEARSCTVKIDAEGPVTSARSATVRRGRRVTLRYRVNDLTPRAKVRIVVRTRAGAARKTLRPGWRGTNVRRSAWFRCRLARGTYRYFVYAIDQAGNRQKRLGSARLVVR
jgi:hypothetical protein